VFFRRSAYFALGPMKAEFGLAADWELWVRVARRYELRRLDGHVRSIRADREIRRDPACAVDIARARDAFSRTFGTAGRVRCRLIEAAHRLFDQLRKLSGGPRFFFPLPISAANPLPPGDAPDRAPGQPICPLTDRPPDRLLFSTRDTAGGDCGIHHVYYDSSSGAALAFPPLPLERLDRMYAKRGARPAEVTPPDPAHRSPYARYRRGVLGPLLQRLPTPYWRFIRPQFHDATGDEAIRILNGLLDPSDAAVRLLNVGCFDGGILDRFKAETRWQLCGTETNAAAAATARAKGHVVHELAPQEVALALPVGEMFDVVVLANTVEHLQNPLLVLRRLRQVLRPGGLIVLNQPNLDSAHARLFGPTWAHWQVPYHRILVGRRGLARMAMLADLRVVRFRTRTFPYPTCVSVQLNELGLGAVVPDSARFPDAVASRGARLAGWSRLLWDWRGRGDFLFAVLKAV